ncbi:hypothetical protein BDW66DRAFT_154259 [Aspergillus desertorum]
MRRVQSTVQPEKADLCAVPSHRDRMYLRPLAANTQGRAAHFGVPITEVLAVLSNDDIKSNPSTTGVSPGRLPWTPNPAALVGHYMSMAAGPPFMEPPQQQNDSTISQAPTPADTIIHHTWLLSDFRSTANPFSAAVTRVPTPSTDYAGPWDLGAPCGGNSTTIGMAMPSRPPTGPTTESSSPADGECTCHTGTTGLLARMRSGAGDDDHHGRLASIRCPHIGEDAEPIHVMVVTTLIGYVINEFEMLATKSPLPRPSAAAEELAGSRATERSYDRSSGSEEASYSRAVSGANVALDSVMRPPRLSWGILELEDDEGEDLRQRLCLLAFRKLERLLWQLMQCLRNLHDTQSSSRSPSRHMAFMTACEYTCLWLQKKAEGVKGLFLDPAREKTAHPPLP